MLQYCVFCRNNNEPEYVYKSHPTRDVFNRILCSRLRAYVCPICGESGDNAHTIKYCPKKPILTMDKIQESNSRKRLNWPKNYHPNFYLTRNHTHVLFFRCGSQLNWSSNIILSGTIQNDCFHTHYVECLTYFTDFHRHSDFTISILQYVVNYLVRVLTS